jgi:predicted anti-sigma-YlaC factor YlaD
LISSKVVKALLSAAAAVAAAAGAALALLWPAACAGLLGVCAAAWLLLDGSNGCNWLSAYVYKDKHMKHSVRW